MKKVLIVDDDPHIVRTLEIMLQDEGFSVVTAASGETAVDLLNNNCFEIAFLDLQLPGMSGLDVLRHMRERKVKTEAIIITAYASIESAVGAMKDGAFDYLSKPFSPDQVRHRLHKLKQMKQLQDKVAVLQRRLGEHPFKEKFITNNATMLQVLNVAENVAHSEMTVLISGESGTGKTLLARLIHEASSRAKGPFVTLDCTCFQESLLESELFGHKKGAFTGALADKVGKAELANGGTLFLDEIGEIPLHLQGKLLRLVDERTYERLGDPLTRTLDIRIIAATNRDLKDMVDEKNFREDLFFRLSVVDLTLPPLRNRPEDILFLARELVSRFADEHRKGNLEWSEELETLLLSYSWPGNVRELSHALERAVLLTTGTSIGLEHIPGRIRDSVNGCGQTDTAQLSLAQIEEMHMRKILALNLSIDETSRRLGIDPSTLWRKRKRYSI